MNRTTPLKLQGLGVSDGICIGTLITSPDEASGQGEGPLVLLSHDLGVSPSTTLSAPNIKAAATVSGSTTSHGAIIARSRGIPAVMGIFNLLETLSAGEKVIVDGTEGVVIVAPTDEQLSEYAEKQRTSAEFICASEAYIDKPTVMKDEKPFKLMVNMDILDNKAMPPSDIGEKRAKIVAASDGAGLIRTESLFENRMEAPSEDEQYQIYSELLKAMGGKAANFRLLDAGGDKMIPYLNTRLERNPFMGMRGIRLILDRPDVLKPQLRALLRAANEGELRILAPMITRPEEIHELKRVLEECASELSQENKAFRHPVPLGIMIETPAAAFTSDIILNEVDFAYMGTNDLSAYIMCADRSNSLVAQINSCFEPAVIRAMLRISTAAREKNVPLGMCGEVAYTQALTPLFLAMGLANFSIPWNKFLLARYAISCWTREEAIEVTKHVLELTGASEIKEYLENEVKRRLPQ